MHLRYRLRQLRRRGLLFVAVVLAIMVIGLVANAQLDPGQKPQAIPPTALPVPPWDATSQPSPQASTVSQSALTGPVQVVQGTRMIDGVALGFPHSTVGAVSAADEFTTAILSTLDPDRAAAVMRLVADPAYPGGPRQAAEGIAGVRRSLGIPATGLVPIGASFAFTPVEYQVRGVSSSTVTVLLLSDLISTAPGQGTVTEVTVFPVAMHWAEADWKILSNPVGDYRTLTAVPGTPQAAADGWQDLVPAGGS
jgi:hypothetical protein